MKYLGDVGRRKEDQGDRKVADQRDVDAIGPVVLEAGGGEELEALLSDPAFLGECEVEPEKRTTISEIVGLGLRVKG